MRWISHPRAPRHYDELISSGQKEKDKHCFEDQCHLTFLKIIPAPKSPSHPHSLNLVVLSPQRRL